MMMTLKKVLILLSLAMVFLFNFVFAEEQSTKIHLFVDDKPVNYDNNFYGDIVQSQSGEFFIPLKLLVEQIDLELLWDSNQRSFILSNYDIDGNLLQKLKFNIDDKAVYNDNMESDAYGDKAFTLSAAPYIAVKNNRIYFPLTDLDRLYSVNYSFHEKMKFLALTTADPNGKYYQKAKAAEACGIYYLRKRTDIDNGRDLYRYSDKITTGNPADSNYSANKDKKIIQLNNKWLTLSDNRLSSDMYFSGFTIYDLGGANNIYVDFGRKDLSVVISRWHNSKNAKPIFKDVLNLFLQSNKTAVETIYKEVEQMFDTGYEPLAAYNWREINDDISYRIELIAVLDGDSIKNLPVIKVRLNDFWHK